MAEGTSYLLSCTGNGSGSSGGTRAELGGSRDRGWAGMGCRDCESPSRGTRGRQAIAALLYAAVNQNNHKDLKIGVARGRIKKAN